MWYWKDLLNNDDVKLRTWGRYIASAKKLNAVLRPQGIEGVHLVGVGHSPDIEFYPSLWMQGGEIIKQKSGHPTKSFFPGFNNTKGVPLGFINAEIDAG